MIGYLVAFGLYALAGLFTAHEWSKANDGNVSKKAQLAIVVLWWVVVGKWILEGLHEIFTKKK